MSTNTKLIPTINVAGDAGQSLVTALGESVTAKKRLKAAANTAKAKNGSVTRHVVEWASEIRSQMGERKIAVGSKDGEYTAIRLFLVDNGADKSLATNMAQLTSWLVNDESLVKRANLSKDESFVGWQRAHAAVKALVDPAARTYKDSLGELNTLLGEESDEWKAAIAGLSGRDIFRAIAQFIENGNTSDDAEDGEAEE